ncbi:MAG: type II toxin-antitoxin system RelE/ParE family toxin [Sporomusaceae bacterium]|jgi:plasmid stabilization system protein ParE|nr:type II toxin-antitoxin system RelE/ParE family toxin [Sporomusaceae bacterium]
MERYKVLVTQSANTDVVEIGNYIAVKLAEPVTADKLIEAIQYAVLGLSHMPHRCPLVDDKHLAGLGYRKLHVKNYLVFFTIDEKFNTVNVERILYARRDWLHIL